MRVAVIAAVAWLSGSIAHAADFKVTSPDVAADKAPTQEFIYNGFGCTGGNQSPALQWRGAPAGTQSFALNVYDPDAPTGSGFWHWVVVNLPADTTSLPRGAGLADGSKLPKGARQINTDYGTPGYGGPCPPAGDKPHRYIVTVYALKIASLPLPPNATAALAGFMINANLLDKASFTFTYGRD
jgi:Raf kinase inhibitor-like YbhB/YbcL family protein